MVERTDSFEIGDGFSRITKHNGYNGGDYLNGEVATAHGFVCCYAQGSDQLHKYSQLNFIFDGRLYMRTFDKRYSARGLVLKAKQFAREISEASDEY